MSNVTALCSVYDGQRCVGFVLERGRRGYESFTADEQSLGLFETRDAAINKITNGARNAEE
jgi:hypothetical protein